MQEVVEEAIERGIVEIALIHDVKRSEPQYAGTVRANVADLLTRPLGPRDSPVVVFHNIDPKPTVEEMAALGLMIGRTGGSSLSLADELYQGLKSRMTFAGPSFGTLLREGSSARASSGWTTQIPQALPTEALDLTETVAIFMLQGRSLSYVMDAFRLPPAAARIIRNLQRGEFILVTQQGDWDWTIYGPN